MKIADDNDDSIAIEDSGDSSSYAGAVVVGVFVAVLYFASGGRISDSTLFGITLTVLLLYVVTGPFRNHWLEVKFWAVVAALFSGHTVLLRYLPPHLRTWSFWAVVMLAVPEGLAMIVIIGWLLRDNYFTRNTRRERTQMTARDVDGGHNNE